MDCIINLVRNIFLQIGKPKGIKNIKLTQDIHVVICAKKWHHCNNTHIALLRTKNWSIAPRRVRRIKLINEQYRRNGPVWDIVINDHDIARDERFMNMPDNVYAGALC